MNVKTETMKENTRKRMKAIVFYLVIQQKRQGQ